MKKILKLTLMLALCIAALCSCSKGDITVPEGLQIVHENKSEGYVFFGPEGWVVANHGGISSTYLSTTSKTSMTFTRITLSSEETISDYFTGNLSKFPYPVTFYKNDEALGEGVAAQGTATNFGTAEAGASSAYKYIYSYSYGDTCFTSLQILLKHGDDHYVFTYTANGLPTDAESVYKNHLDKVQAVIDNFYFTEKSSSSSNPEYTRDEDGYKLVSDKTVSGFEVYVPEDYTVLNNSGIVELKINDNASISLTRASETGLGVLDYLLNRRANILKIADDFTDIQISVAKPVNTDSEYFDDWELEILPIHDETLVLGDLDVSRVAAYEYSYTYNGTTYRVYQVLGTDNLYGYVFTYTATESEYGENFIEINTILEKVSFR